jgi:very-short-patch-repair endonuclease
MNEYTRNLEELLHLSTKKCHLLQHLKKNYKENVHYIKIKSEPRKQNGGQNKIVFMLTQKAFELLKNSFNLRNRYIVDAVDNFKQVNVGMCIENQKIGFIENAYGSVFNVIRQHYIGKYRVDLCIVDHKLAIECDENGHNDRGEEKERVREGFIIASGYKIIRYNPNITSFDLSNVLRKINKVIFTKSS